MPLGIRPNFEIQTASLYASGDSSTFTGTGGPAGFDPFLAGFDSVVSAAGIALHPFSDSVNNVDAGDQIVFVIALTNFGGAASDLKLRDTIPLGFVIPDAGPDLTVTDGAGNPLDFSGNLFDPAGGLTILDPVAAYDPNSGANVVLATFTVQAASTIAVPSASVSNGAQIVSYAASAGGANLAPSNANSLFAATTVQTAPLTATSVADQPATTLASGQLASFDVTVSLPEGSVQDLRITEALPMSGGAGFSLVSAEIVSFGAHLSASAPVFVQPDGTVALGTVTDTPDNLATADDQITLRLTVQNGGTTAGVGTLATTVSTADPNHPGQRLSTLLSNTDALAKPDSPPAIAGASPAQNTTSSTSVLPFSTILLSDPDIGQLETLAIHISDTTLGTLSGLFITNAAGDAVLTGTADTIQAAARTLLFTPAAGAVGTEHFSLSLNDGYATALDTQTSVTIAAASQPIAFPHFSLSAQSVLTSTPTGSTTVTPLEAYQGGLDHIEQQFLYDGANALAIVAQQNNLFVSSQAAATAVQLASGVNLLDIEHGSSFIVGGTGTDTLILHADQPQVTWNTVANFSTNDSITLYGFEAGVSRSWWVDNAGAPGWTGATLHMDLDGDGTIDSSLTFAGLAPSMESHINLQPGVLGNNYYLAISRS